MKKFAVFGNPIGHSKSPYIHNIFAKSCGIKLQYDPVCVPLDSINTTIEAFFDNGGLGANITLPFKEHVYGMCDELTERAILAKAVNTIKLLDDGRLLGDNTDGAGLLYDLKRLHMIQPKSYVLLIGAGGAARGVIHPLLSYGCELVITNRTYSKAQSLVDSFSQNELIKSKKIDELSGEKFDLIINATSAGVSGSVPAISSSVISNETACYDMFYQNELTAFLTWAQSNGAVNYADGLGMLVGQAAYSFQLWHGVMPDIENALHKLRESLKK